MKDSKRVVIDTSNGGSVFFTSEEDGTVWMELVTSEGRAVDFLLDDRAIRELKEALEEVEER